MKIVIDEGRREFIAKTVSDIGKTIFAVGLASYFFERFPIIFRIILNVMWVICLIGSVFIKPIKGGNKTWKQ